ncbi:hypothetical protein A2803_01060 [Candidatus Woesebacteria bacterium RIFCSPHIGHO2_01_FULL_44_21]|uniref:LytR/CpsA/Psr regulator C-terminal domain-containing protein n=1 Tax=Candidatus Woesebacteria bacterium RIFCSPHIGHO2_01_FULL_44_21 TaxID=1802503 RepID=A0A1F7YX57_9BACT|nr:MAG: hypothetical protein A2803_01060 [Candidatus Woesebacteria bacterium RIFCSPHIGHO2_01_FULL_44_21]OGM69723.1 MAG: hypothetical protein A2897_00250 [Candidatus Woesebacteria bacterium RIFCSPLOWO2_01_FULL_44_24b]
MPEDHKKHLKPVVEEVVEEKEEDKAPVVESPVESVIEAPSEPAESEPVVEKESKKMNLKLVVVITLVSSLVAAFVSGGVYVYLSSVESAKPAPETATPSPEATANPEFTTTPEPEPVDLSKYSVRVLNGSGAIGAAGAGEDILVEAGFTVGATGNAANYNFKSTVIQAKADVPAETVSRAKEALEKADYKVEVGEALPSSSQYAIVVTMGPN